MLLLTDDDEFLYQDLYFSNIMRYNAATKTESVFVNSSFLVSIVFNQSVFDNRAVCQNTTNNRKTDLNCFLSAFTSTLVIPSTRRTTPGDRAFPVTAARAWNALPSSVRSAPSLLQFRRDLKTALFQSSYSSPWCSAV